MCNILYISYLVQWSRLRFQCDKSWLIVTWTWLYKLDLSHWNLNHSTRYEIYKTLHNTSQSPHEFSACLRALIPFKAPAAIRQHGSRIGQPALPINGRTSPAFRRFLPDNIPHLATRGYLLLPNPRVIKYSDDTFFLFPPHHRLYHLPAPFPDNSIMIVVVV
jgi:hypothetical protein